MIKISKQKTNWQTKKLGEVCDILDNKRKPITKRNRISGKYPYYGATGILDYVRDYIFDEKLVLIGEDGAKWGSGEYTAFIANGKYWVNNHAHVIRPYRNIILDDWIVFFFYLNNLTKHTTGLTVPKLNQTNLRNIQISFPLLFEQRRIVKILDEVFKKTGKAKENAEKNLQNTKELFESYLQNIFTNPGKDWEVIDFEDSIEKVIYTNKIKRNKFLKSGKFPVISQEKDLINGYWDKENDLFHIKTPVIIFGDHTQILKYIDFDFVLGADGVKILQPRNFLFPKFLYYFLKSIKLKSLGYARHYRLLKEKQIFYPKSILEQKSIVRKLDELLMQTKKLEEIYKKKLLDLEELKKSVLKRAFSGEL